MLKLITFVQAYTTDEEGATAIEYGLLAAGIAMAIAVAVFSFGDRLELLFEEAEAGLDGTP